MKLSVPHKATLYNRASVIRWNATMPCVTTIPTYA